MTSVGDDGSSIVLLFLFLFFFSLSCLLFNRMINQQLSDKPDQKRVLEGGRGRVWVLHSRKLKETRLVSCNEW